MAAGPFFVLDTDLDACAFSFARSARSSQSKKWRPIPKKDLAWRVFLVAGSAHIVSVQRRTDRRAARFPPSAISSEELFHDARHPLS
jgi:hypothetical protein